MNKRKTRLGLVLATVAFASLAFSQPARAADYTGDCANIPDHVTGDAVVSDSACVIDTGATLIVDGTLTINAVSVDVKSEIQAVSKVTIRTTTGELKLRRKASSQFSDILLQAPQNRIETKVLEAGNSVQVDAGLNGAEGSIRDIVIDGRIVVNKHQPFPSPDIHANVLLRASGPISTKTIRTDGALGATNIKSGGIQIEAYRTIALAEGAGEFVIGGPGVNGVDGELITRSSVGGGTNSVTTIGGVNIVNGNRFSQGSIRLVNVSAIKINATQSRSGFLELNAQAGKIFLPEGRLDSDSAPGHRAGIVLLLAKTLDVQPGTIISASQAQDDPGSSHQVVIAAETVKFRGGEAGGLKVLADGHGVPGYFGLVQLVPYGYLTPVNTTDQHNNVNQMFWTYTVNTPELAKDGPLTLDGTEGNAPLLLRANGNTAAVNVSGYPLTFKGGDVTIRSRGQTLHRINVGFFGVIGSSGRPGLLLNTTENFVVDADGAIGPNGEQGNGGIVQIFSDQTSLTAPRVAISADGEPLGGDGGTVEFRNKTIVSTARTRISADGAIAGFGNAVFSPLNSTGPQAIKFNPGTSTITLGKGLTEFMFSATGGTSGGNGGGVLVQSDPAATILLRDDENVIDVSAFAGASNAGGIKLDGKHTRFLLPAGDRRQNVAIRADGGPSGLGGNVIISKANGPQRGTPPTATLELNPSISVESGNAGLITKDGSVTIADVKCQKLRTGEASWLKSYWRCADPDAVGGLYGKPAEQANSLALSNVRQSLSTSNVLLYVFSGVSDYNKFFDRSVNDREGDTITYLNAPNLVETSVFPLNPTEENLREVTTHELAHSLDNNGNASNPQSNLSDYQKFLFRDFFTLDYLSQGSTAASSPPRNACLPVVDEFGIVVAQAPFANTVIEGTTQSVCNNGVLNPRYIDSQTGQPFKNSTIAFDASGLFSPAYELYAQSYAIEVYAKTISEINRKNKTIDILIGSNGFMQCTAKWAAYRNTGNLGTPPVSQGDSCLAPVPADYQPGG